jgi:hypothetical protein
MERGNLGGTAGANFKTLAAIVNEPHAPYAARVAAVEALLDRGHGREARRPASVAVNQIRVRRQSANGQGDRPRSTAVVARPRRRGDRVDAAREGVRDETSPL